MLDNRNQAENGAPSDDMTGAAHHEQDIITPTKPVRHLIETVHLG